MKPREQLDSLYRQWRELTEREAEAIRVGAWSKLTGHHAAKAALQILIRDQSGLLENECAGDRNRQADDERHFRRTVDELIVLEKRNLQLLDTQRDCATQQREALETSSRHLRQLHRSYVPVSPAHWHSYS